VAAGPVWATRASLLCTRRLYAARAVHVIEWG
jgi:hypothetical protein